LHLLTAGSIIALVDITFPYLITVISTTKQLQREAVAERPRDASSHWIFRIT